MKNAEVRKIREEEHKIPIDDSLCPITQPPIASSLEPTYEIT